MTYYDNYNLSNIINDVETELYIPWAFLYQKNMYKKWFIDNFVINYKDFSYRFDL